MKIVNSFLSVITGLVLLLFASARVYTNHNDGFYVNGRGWLVVKGCREAGKDYLCTGSFQQHGGMISVKDASVKTEQSYQPGQYIEDIFPHYTYRGNEVVGATLETGSTRRSLAHNALSIFLGVIGLGLMTLAYFISRRNYSLH